MPYRTTIKRTLPTDTDITEAVKKDFRPCTVQRVTWDLDEGKPVLHSEELEVEVSTNPEAHGVTKNMYHVSVFPCVNFTGAFKFIFPIMQLKLASGGAPQPMDYAAKVYFDFTTDASGTVPLSHHVNFAYLLEELSRSTYAAAVTEAFKREATEHGVAIYRT